jgi:hypothetical protein
MICCGTSWAEKNTHMKTASETPGNASPLTVNPPEATENPPRAVFNREEARKAAAETDRIREENRRKFGVQGGGAEIIREFRGPLPG